MNKIKLWHSWHSSIFFALCLLCIFPVCAQETTPHCPVCRAYDDFIRSLETARNTKSDRLRTASQEGQTLTNKGLSGPLTPDERESLSRLRRETEQISRELPLIDQKIVDLRGFQANCVRACSAPATQPETPPAACPACETARAALVAKRAELKQKQDELDANRKRNAEDIFTEQIPDLMEQVERAEQAMRAKQNTINRLEQEAQALQRQLEKCTQGCVPPPPANLPLVIPGTATPVPAPTGERTTPSGQAPFTPLPPGSLRAACPACESARAALADKRGELGREQNQLETYRKNFTDITINQDRRVPDDPEIIRARIIAVQQYEQLIRTQTDKVNKLEQEEQDLQRQLDACNLRCAQPQKSGCSFPPVKPIAIGPRDQFGEKSIGQKIGEKAQGMLGGMLGGMFGGAIGLGGGGNNAANARPDEVPDPVKDKQQFRGIGAETSLRIGAVPDPAKDGLRLSAYIEDSASKGVVHSIHRETMDQNCIVDYQMPSDYWLYEIWLEWSLTVWWSKDTYVDNQLVKHEQGGWQKEGKEMLGSGIFDASKDIPKTAWGQLGFDRAFAGPRSIGATFPGVSYPSTPDTETKQTMERYVIHVSEPHLDPVSTTPFTFYPKRGADGKIAFTDQAPEYRLPKMKLEGGMQQIDPPAPQGQAPQGSILDSIEGVSGAK
ncbi:MAG: hypothetical protein HZA59_14760 [Hydrogenophilales bacterium]|nr:hypothetical protein [Hydrogenophilales bacterium]